MRGLVRFVALALPLSAVLVLLASESDADGTCGAKTLCGGADGGAFLCYDPKSAHCVSVSPPLVCNLNQEACGTGTTKTCYTVATQYCADPSIGVVCPIGAKPCGTRCFSPSSSYCAAPSVVCPNGWGYKNGSCVR